MKALIFVCLIIGFISISHAACSTSLCFQRCSISKQLNVYVQPSSYSDAACDFLHSAPNNCCLLNSNSAGGTTYQTWCCPNVQATITNINNSGLSYLHVSSKRSIENVEDNHSDGTDANSSQNDDEKSKEVIKSLTDRLKKIYKNTYIHPYEVLKSRYNFSTEKRSNEEISINLPDHHILMAEPNFDVTINSINEIDQLDQDEEYGPPFVVEYSQTNSGSFSSAPNWNQDRIDQRSLPLDSTYQPLNPGNSKVSAIKIHVYIVDTGINPVHTAFDSVTISVDFPGPSARDCNGHGTHVASTVAGIASGVLSAVQKSSGTYDVVIHAIKVLGCDGSGTTSDVLNGLIWVYNNVQYPAIISMSLGSTRSYSIDNVVQLLINDKNIPVIAAAGNDGSDACNVSPGGGTNVVTVASSNIADTFSSFSNRGSCVDIIAPGEDITGAYYANPSAFFRLSGTSMATPHVSGAVAGMTLEQLSTTQIGSNLVTIAKSTVDLIMSRSTRNMISSMPSSTVNYFLYYGPNNIQTTPPPPSTTTGNDSISHRPYMMINIIIITTLFIMS